jgi:hypothetical protein
MGKTKFKFSMKGFEELRRRESTVAYLQGLVDRVAGMAGEGYASRVDQAPGGKTLGRATGRVIAVHPKARASNAKHNTLVNLIDELGP